MAKFDINVVDCVPGETLARNRAACDVPAFIQGGGHLAVVGGGPSINDRVADLRDHDGDVWAINGAWSWCRERMIPAYFYSADPRPGIADMCKGALAVLAAHCDPKTFAAARTAWKTQGPNIGPSSACSTLGAAIRAGYRKVTYYGCESSWTENTHAYQHEYDPDWLCVRVDGEEFLTNLHLLSQAGVLAEVLRAAPSVYSEKSGGMLRALIANPEWDAIYGAKSLVDTLTRAA